jgi:hypothetical protein
VRVRAPAEVARRRKRMSDTVQDQPAVVAPEDDIEPRDADATGGDGDDEGGKDESAKDEEDDED